MKTSLLAMATLAVSVATAAATAEEYAIFRNLQGTSAAVPECRGAMLLNQPPAWRNGDDAVVLITFGPPHDPVRDALASALLQEQSAVLEVAPAACDDMRGGRDRAVAAALGALDAMTREAGAGRFVAVALGAGGRAVLDVLHEPVASRFATTGSRYAAVVAIGDGAPAFVLARPSPSGKPAAGRLAALCHALAAIVGGMGATPDRAAPAAAAAACDSAMSGDEAELAASGQIATTRR